MKRFFLFLLLTTSISFYSQIKIVVDRDGISPSPITRKIQPMSDERFVEIAENWIQEFSNGDYSVSEVTPNSLTIDAFRDNAFLYRSKGDTFFQNIKYQIKASKEENEYRLTFKIIEIYANKVLLKSKIADYFNENGTPKADFIEVKPTLEKTITIITNSFDKYLNTIKP